MSAPSPARGGPVRLLLLVLAALLAATLLGAAPAPASARDDLSDVDAPVLPPGCFGPARTGIDPFPCPLNTYREKRPTIILWGDSHAYMYIPALKEAVRGQKVNLVSFVAGSCPPVLITRPDAGGACRRSNYVALRTVQAMRRERKDVKVVLGSNWSGFRRAYRQIFLEGATGQPSGYNAFTKEMVRLAHEGTPALFDRLGRMGIDVDIIGQAATVPERRAACAAGDQPYNCDLPRWRAIPEERRTRGYLKRQQAKIRVDARSRIIDATPGYCTETVCRGKVGAIETYFDDLHLSATRTRNLARYFRASVDAVRR